VSATPERVELTVAADAADQRLDRWLTENWGGVSRSQLKQRLVGVWVDGKAAKLSQPVSPGQTVVVELAPLPPVDLAPEDIPLDIIFENDDVVVIDKPAGLVVHPAAGNRTGTLVHGLLHHLEELKDQDFDDESRPGIVHRLDKDTSGVLIVAKNPAAHEFLATQFQERSTQKTYLAIGIGVARFGEREVSGCICRDPAMRQRFMHHATAGKPASSRFEVLASGSGLSLFRVTPRTGRTHQIRVHARHLGFPLLADPIYGKPDKRFPGLRLMLHACRLRICLPGETEPRTFTAPVPADIRGVAEAAGFVAALSEA
jgi:23S rRNA pseudouridine1911/1915/1917 synthase